MSRFASASAESIVGRGSRARMPLVKRSRAVSAYERTASAARSVARLSAEIASTFTVCVSVESESGGTFTCAIQSSTIFCTAPGSPSSGDGSRGMAPEVRRGVPKRMPRAATVSTTTFPSRAGRMPTSKTIASASNRFVIGFDGSVTASPESVTCPSRTPTCALARSTFAPTAAVPPASMPRRTAGSRKSMVPPMTTTSRTTSGMRAFQRIQLMGGTARRPGTAWRP